MIVFPPRAPLTPHHAERAHRPVQRRVHGEGTCTIPLGWSWLVIVGTAGTMLFASLLAPVLDRARAA